MEKEMEGLEAKVEETAGATTEGGGWGGSVVVELPLGKAAATFDLEKAVCSHGLFMMAPNYWDPLSKTLQRPLTLDFDDDYGNDASLLSLSPASLIVRISHPSKSPQSLRLRVFGADSLSPRYQQVLLDQVRRMLRLSEAEEANVARFQNMHTEAKQRGFGRVFRSPTLFEDMVKCMLLCNCQWSRTLSMARALCELQLELQCSPFSELFAKADNGTNSGNPTAKTEHFVPKTPAGKESKRKKLKTKKGSSNFARCSFSESKVQIEAETDTRMGSVEISDWLQQTQKLCTTNGEEDLHDCCNSCQTSTEICKANSMKINGANLCLFSNLQCSEGTKHFSQNRIGNFPSPRELARLDEKFLAKRCNLGYRASRILNLAQSIVGGKIQLRQLEEACRKPNLLDYNKVADQLKEIDGFGHFTCANVLMCMGFYHVIPTDSETFRHLKQVHKRDSSLKTVQRDVEAIYGKYEPFQFLAYWSEVWHFYEEWFGKLSEMPCADYKLITAANMRPKKDGKIKRTKRNHNKVSPQRTKYSC